MTAYTAASDPTNVVGKRIGAWVIDLLIYLAVAAAVTAMTGGVQIRTGEGYTEQSAEMYCDAWRETHEGFCTVSRSSGSSDEQTTAFDDDYSITTIEGSLGGVAQWFGHLVVYAVIQGLLGGSLGKLALGLRVVDENGKVIGIGRSFVRTLAWIGDALTCGLPIIGGVMMVSTKGHRRLGDMIAGTYVVDKGSVGQPINANQPSTPDAGPWTPPSGQWGAPGGQWGGSSPGAWGTPPPGPVGPPTGNPWTPGGGSPAQGSPFGGPSTGSAPPPGDGPTWDPARNAYIQYDRDTGAWVQWDDNLKVWAPISQ